MDTTMSPSGSWETLYNRYYSKEDVYDMAWGDINLANFIVAAAPYGGPVACIRDPNQMQAYDASTASTIGIYTSSGEEMARVDPRMTSTTSSHVKKMGWTASAHLVVVHEDGTVNVYDVHGAFVATFSAAPDAMVAGVHDAQIWGGGLVVMTMTFQLYAVEFGDESFESIRPRRLADPELTTRPPSWVVIPPEQALSRTVEVLVATAGGSVIAVDGDMAQDQLLTEGPFIKMALSPSGKMVAMYNRMGVLLVVSSDFQKNLSEFDTQRVNEPPEQLVWCGTDSVIMYWHPVLCMVGPYGDIVKYQEDSPAALITETDGIRILTTEKCQLLRRVPDSAQSIFLVGSTEPAAILYDALDAFQKNSPKAYEYINSIKGSLQESVEACIDAAGHMLESRLQRKLLQAASFGKCFLEMYDPKAFVDMARTLRVLNAARFYEVGIPITYAQYQELTPKVLISRLINRHHHLLAYRICEYLELPTNRVLIHWACAKIVRGSHMSDPELCRAIVDRLAPVKGISYVEIAETAFRRGHTELATSLLDYEPRPAQQVPLLMTMQEDELALTKAIESGDTDLVYLVLLELKTNRSIEYLFRVVANKPVAADLLATYCKSQDLEMLKDFFYQADQPHESANIMVREGYASPDMGERERKLRQAITFYADSRESMFEASSTKEQLNLLSFQVEMERRTGLSFVDLSLSSTISQCASNAMLKDAAKLKSHFKVPNKRYSWLMVKALARSNNWAELEKFSKASRKSPIGFEPFAQAAIDAGHVREAAKYIPRVNSADSRAELWMKVGDIGQAAQAAYDAKNVDMLQALLPMARSEEAAHIRMCLGKLQ